MANKNDPLRHAGITNPLYNEQNVQFITDTCTERLYAHHCPDDPDLVMIRHWVSTHPCPGCTGAHRGEIITNYVTYDQAAALMGELALLLKENRDYKREQEKKLVDALTKIGE